MCMYNSRASGSFGQKAVTLVAVGVGSRLKWQVVSAVALHCETYTVDYHNHEFCRFLKENPA